MKNYFIFHLLLLIVLFPQKYAENRLKLNLNLTKFDVTDSNLTKSSGADLIHHKNEYFISFKKSFAKLDKNLKIVKTIAKRGPGPGEIDDFIKNLIPYKDSIFVFTSRKIHIFLTNGKFIKTHKLIKPLNDFYCDTKGNRYYLYFQTRYELEAEGNVFCVKEYPDGKKVNFKLFENKNLPLTLTPIIHDLGNVLAFSLNTNDHRLFCYDTNGKYLYTKTIPIRKNTEHPTSTSEKRMVKFSDDRFLLFLTFPQRYSSKKEAPFFYTVKIFNSKADFLYDVNLWEVEWKIAFSVFDGIFAENRFIIYTNTSFSGAIETYKTNLSPKNFIK